MSKDFESKLSQSIEARASALASEVESGLSLAIDARASELADLEAKSENDLALAIDKRASELVGLEGATVEAPSIDTTELSESAQKQLARSNLIARIQDQVGTPPTTFERIGGEAMETAGTLMGGSEDARRVFAPVGPVARPIISPVAEWLVQRGQELKNEDAERFRRHFEGDDLISATGIALRNAPSTMAVNVLDTQFGIETLLNQQDSARAQFTGELAERAELSREQLAPNTPFMIQAGHDIANSVIDMIPQIPMFVAGGPMGVGLGVGIRETGSSAREHGDTGKAIAKGALTGLTTFYLQRIFKPLEYVMRGAPLGKAGIGEAFEEGGQELTNTALDALLYDTPTGGAEDILKRVGYSMLIGFGAGESMATGTRIANAPAKLKALMATKSTAEKTEAMQAIAEEFDEIVFGPIDTEVLKAEAEKVVEDSHRAIVDGEPFEGTQFEDAEPITEGDVTLDIDEEMNVDLSDLLLFAEQLQVRVNAGDLRENVRGAYRFKEGTELNDIIINRKNYDPAFVRKTLAHEIGHFLSINGDVKKTAKRGNILGKIAKFNEVYRKNFLARTKADQDFIDHDIEAYNSLSFQAKQKAMDDAWMFLKNVIQPVIKDVRKSSLGWYTESTIEKMLTDVYDAEKMTSEQRLKSEADLSGVFQGQRQLAQSHLELVGKLKDGGLTKADSKAFLQDYYFKKIKELHKETFYSSEARKDAVKEARKFARENKIPKDQVNELANEYYEKRMKIVQRNLGLISSREVMAELKQASSAWRGAFLPDNKYRNSSEELFADGLSMLILNPKALKDIAPTFYDAVQTWYANDPVAWKNYQDTIQQLAHDPQKLPKQIDRMIEAQRKGFDIRKEKPNDDPIWKRIVNWFSLAELEQYTDIIDRTSESGKDYTERVLGDMAYASSMMHGYMKNYEQTVTIPLDKLNIDINKFGSYLIARRIAHGDRGNVPNTFGIDVGRAKKLIAEMENLWGADTVKSMKEIADNYNALRQEFIIKKMAESGVYTETQIEQLVNNVYFAKFQDLYHLSKENGEKATLRLLETKGSFNEIDNPLIPTLKTDLAVFASIAFNTAKSAVGVELSEAGHATPAKVTKIGKRQQIDKNEIPRGQGVVSWVENGELKGVYMDKFLAEAFNAETSRELAVFASVMQMFNTLPRNLMTSLNPAFWPVNWVKDTRMALVNLPKGKNTSTTRGFLKNIFGAMKESAKWEMGLGSKEIDEMIQKGRLISFNPRKYDEELMSLGDMSAKNADEIIKESGAFKAKADVVDSIKKLKDHWEGIGNIFEKTTRVAVNRALEADKGFTDDEITMIVRKEAGPDFLARGRATFLTNSTFLYSNAQFQGLRGSIRAMKRNPTRFAMRLMTATALRIGARILAMYGLFGDDAEEFWNKVTEYDKTNYDILPLGIDSNGKSVYIRIPMGDFERAISGILFQNYVSPMDVAGHLHGLTPTLSPILKFGWENAQLLGKNNPYDSFYGRKVYDESVYDTGGVNLAKEYGKRTWKTFGGDTIYRAKHSWEGEPTNLAEEIVNTPIVGKVLRRFLVSTDYGEQQKYQGAVDWVRKIKAQEQMDARSGITKLAKGKGAEVTDEEKRAMSRRRSLLKDIEKQYIKNKGNALQRTLVSAENEAERIAILLEHLKLSGENEPMQLRLQKYLHDTLGITL